MLRTKQTWYNACYYLGKLAVQHSKAFCQELQIHFFEFWIEICLAKQIYDSEGTFPPSEMTLDISSPAIYLCVSVCLCDSVETGFIRPHFSVPQKTVWSCLWNPFKNHKNPCVQAEHSPVAKCLGNVCSKKSLFNDMTRNLDLTLRPIISGGKTSNVAIFSVL